MQNDKIVNQIKKVLENEKSLCLAILYGSYANGKVHPQSDVDIAVLYDYPLNAPQKNDLLCKLGDKLHKEIDLTDLYNLNGTILQQILCKGRLVIEKQPSKYENLVKRMIYNQADMMPLVQREQKNRLKKSLYE
ncbi:MAG: type VII toxin-antitoxin system MntA family adenylyltransferase antitoxin [Candidatus Rifleibacteriota bacterium]